MNGADGTALSFDGVDDQINLGNSFMNDLLAEGQDFAVAFWWLRPLGNTDNGDFVLWKRQTPEQIKGFYAQYGYVISTQQPFLSLRMHNASEERLAYTHLDNSVSVFHHYVFQRRGSTFEIYLDGVLATSDTDAGNNADIANSSDFELTQHNSKFAVGTMDDFRIYDLALLVDEVANMASA